MEQRFLRGRLAPAADAPEGGERIWTLVELPGLSLEQILSGLQPEAVHFDQDHDEWVLLIEGRAKLLVEGTEVELVAGDWLFLPARCKHTLLETQPGTSWLALHLASH